MKKPKPEDFGFYSATGFDDESGWMYEGGEEKYFEALQKWKAQQEPPYPDDTTEMIEELNHLDEPTPYDP